MRRISRLCDDNIVFREAKSKIMPKYVEADLLPAAIRSADNLAIRAMVPDVFLGAARVEANVVATESKEVWASLHFHPVLERARLQRVFDIVNKKWCGHVPTAQVRLAWKNYAKPLLNKVQFWCA